MSSPKNTRPRQSARISNKLETEVFEALVDFEHADPALVARGLHALANVVESAGYSKLANSTRRRAKAWEARSERPR